MGAVIVGSSVDSVDTHATHVSGMDAMSIDTNITGNGGTAIGANDTCVSANPGASVTVDVTALNIPADKAMTAFGLTVNYDPGAFTVSDSNAAFMLAATPGSSVVNVSDPAPDSDGEFLVAAIDTDITKVESGSGVLIRITIDVNAGASSGAYPLTIAGAAHGDDTNHYYPPATIRNATIAVGQSCTYFGDVDCSSAVNSVDSLKILRYNASLSVSQTEPCTDIGGTLPNTEIQGDVDCSNAINAVDSLKLLRHSASLSVSQTEPCPDIGT